MRSDARKKKSMLTMVSSTPGEGSLTGGRLQSLSILSPRVLETQSSVNFVVCKEAAGGALKLAEAMGREQA